MPALTNPAMQSNTQRTTAADKADPKTGSSAPGEQQKSPGQLNSPALGPTGKPTQRAITTAKQAFDIAKRMRDRAKQSRLLKAAVIAEKYNGGEPFRENELKASGQSWRNNFSTNFLASIVDRVTPQLTDPINKADTLTHSTLPADPNLYPDGATKSRKFGQMITATIRKWPKWKDLLSGLAKEVVLFGNAAPARIDKNWRPRLWSFGECFLPDGCGQHSKDVQVAAFYQSLQMHEFIKLFEDPKLAKAANYNLQGCIEIANRTTASGNMNGPQRDPTPLDIQDSVRDGGLLGWSFENPERKIELFHVLVRDYTGEIDIWTVDANEGTEVRHELGLHDQIEDAIALYTFQGGNRKFYGSKGLGRLEVNLHTAIERGRNLGADQMYLSGLILFQGDPKDAAALTCKVKHPFVVVKAGELIQEKVEFNVETFLQMDQMLVTIAESIAGAFIPPNLEGGGSSNTKIEAAQKAERELAVKEGVLGRFFDHFSEMVGMMQRGICSPENLAEAYRIYNAKKKKMQEKGIRVIWRKVFEILKKAKIALTQIEPSEPIQLADEEAVNCIVAMLEAGLSPEEIVTLSLQPAGSNSNDEGADKDSATVQWIAGNRPNPFLNQFKATMMDATIQIGEDRATQLIIPQDDPTVMAIAKRQQVIEDSEMIDGNAMDVAKTDDHIVHRTTMAKPLGDIINVLASAPTTALLTAAQLMIQHYMDHLQADMITTDSQKKTEMGVMHQWTQTVNAAIKMLNKQSQDAQAKGLPTNPDGQPVPVNGQPPQVGPNGQIIGEGGIGGGMAGPDPETRIRAFEALAEVEARKKDQDLEQQKLNLQVAQHDHVVAKDGALLQQGNMDHLQQIADRTAASSEAAADRQLEAVAQQNNNVQANNGSSR